MSLQNDQAFGREHGQVFQHAYSGPNRPVIPGQSRPLCRAFPESVASFRNGWPVWPGIRIPERNLPISGPAASLRVIFHTVAAHAPKRNILFKCSRWSSSTATTLPCPGRAGSLLRCQPTTVLAGRSAGQNAILPRVDIAGRSYQIHNVEPSLRRETTREMWYELSDVRTWRIDWRSPWTPSDRRHDGVVPRPPA